MKWNAVICLTELLIKITICHIVRVVFSGFRAQFRLTLITYVCVTYSLSLLMYVLCILEPFPLSLYVGLFALDNFKLTLNALETDYDLFLFNSCFIFLIYLNFCNKANMLWLKQHFFP